MISFKIPTQLYHLVTLQMDFQKLKEKSKQQDFGMNTRLEFNFVSIQLESTLDTMITSSVIQLLTTKELS